MKLNLTLALAATLVCAPVFTASAAEKAKAEAAEKKPGPTDAEKAKARKSKKPMYTKLVEAKAVAEKADQPILVVISPEGMPPQAQEFEKKFIKSKIFLKDLAAKNLVLMMLRLKKGSTPKKINTRQLKSEELKFLENFGVNPRDISIAKQYNKPEPVFDDLSNYPAVICVDALCQKQLFRVPREIARESLGTQFANFVELLTNTGMEPELSELVKKIVENPDEPKKWK